MTQEEASKLYQIEVRKNGVLEEVMHVEELEPKPGFTLNQREYMFVIHNIRKDKSFKGQFTSSKGLGIRELVKAISSILESNGDC